MLGDVWSDVGNPSCESLSTRILGNPGGFHTRERTEVESFERITNPVDAGFQIGIVDEALLNFFETMDHRRVITSSKSVAYLDELGSEKLAREIHGNLPRCSKRFRSGL